MRQCLRHKSTVTPCLRPTVTVPVRRMRLDLSPACSADQVGAGTMNPATFLRVLGPEPWNVAYAEPSIRPDDSRYGDNPNRLQRHTQFQVGQNTGVPRRAAGLRGSAAP